MFVDAVRYNGTIHDFVALNALRQVPSTGGGKQINAGLRQYLELGQHPRRLERGEVAATRV